MNVLPACVCALYVYLVPEEVVSIHVGAGNQTQALTTKCALNPLSQCSSPKLQFSVKIFLTLSQTSPYPACGNYLSACFEKYKS